jgi:hypothetical protein
MSPSEITHVFKEFLKEPPTVILFPLCTVLVALFSATIAYMNPVMAIIFSVLANAIGLGTLFMVIHHSTQGISFVAGMAQVGKQGMLQVVIPLNIAVGIVLAIFFYLLYQRFNLLRGVLAIILSNILTALAIGVIDTYIMTVVH